MLSHTQIKHIQLINDSSQENSEGAYGDVWLCEYQNTKICVKYLKLEEEWMREMTVLTDVC